MRSSPIARRPERLLTALLIVLIVLAAVLGWATLTTGHHWGDDYASYIMQAESLLDGSPLAFVHDNAFTIDHSNVKPGPIAYPWGTAAILAIPYRLAGLDILALKAPNCVFLLLFLAFLAIMLRDELGWTEAIVTVAVFALNPTILGFGLNNVGSDLPFLFLSTVSVWLIGRVLIQRRRVIAPLADHLLLGLFMGIAFTIRVNGALLAMTAVAAQSVEWLRQRSSMLDHSTSGRSSRAPGTQVSISLRACAIAISPYVMFALLGFLAYRVLPAGEGSYRAYLSRRSLEYYMGAVRYYGALPLEFYPDVPSAIVFYVASLPFLLLGMLRSIKRWYHVALYVCATLVLCVLWPSRQGLRFLYPVLPFCVAYTVHGASWVIDRTRGRARWAIWAVLTSIWIILATSLAVTSVRQASANLALERRTAVGSFTPEAQAAFDYIRINTPPSAVIAFFKARALRLFTGRRSIQVNGVPSLAEADYLLFYTGPDGYDQLPAETVEKLVQQGELQPVYVTPQYRLYHVKPPG